MALSPKAIQTQLNLLRPLLGSLSLKTLRKWQDRIGELMEARYREQVMVKEHLFPLFPAAWVIPTDQRRQGVILYLHGGGYACGGLDYALGFGSMLSQRTGTRVFCPAYRLAPEAPFPAAVEDALESYRYLLDKGYAGSITLCGESAGGGLCYALCMELKRLGLPMPCGILGISPWTDLTASSSSYEENRDIDPSM
ncbi:MAG: alpha/beta hydrolase fold domain-containing protein, partial [Oscillospiraceae bacterium]|nr:alpha/beta hydrolase fold domain-containing protein [Oscillospiraceae bacterium]